jgi:hypothetical protein
MGTNTNTNVTRTGSVIERRFAVKRGLKEQLLRRIQSFYP